MYKYPTKQLSRGLVYNLNNAYFLALLEKCLFSLLFAWL